MQSTTQPGGFGNRIAVADFAGLHHRGGFEPAPWSHRALAERGFRQVWRTDLGAGASGHYASWTFGRDRISEIIPARSPELAMWQGLDGPALLGELHRFEAATGGELFVMSPAITSDSILRRVHQGPGCRPIGATTEPAIARRQRGRAPEGAEGDLVWWASEPTYTRAMIGRPLFCHHFDLNASYLGAAGSIRLPQGEPRYTDQRRTVEPGSPKSASDPIRRPGYWQVELPLPPRSAGAGPPVAVNRSMRGTGHTAWITTPTLELAASLGPVDVLAGWWWPDSCQGLRPWYERLRDARATLQSGPAYEAVKAIYKRGIGRLGSTRRTNAEGDPLYQPTWRHLVIAEARARVWLRLNKISPPPIAVQVDGAWWLSNIEDPHEWAEVVGLPIDPIRLGHWKWQGSGDAMAAVEALDARDPISRLREVVGR